MNVIALVISMIIIVVGLFLTPRVKVKTIQVTCKKIIDSSSKPLLKPCETGETCEYGEESGHDVHECEQFGYVYTINGVDYTTDGKIIKGKTFKDSPGVLIKNADVEEKDYLINILVVGVGVVSFITSLFIPNFTVV